MRCVACDELLTPREISRKSPITGEEYQLCTPCLKEAGLLIESNENPVAEDVYVDISGLAEEELEIS